jgi:hypothetical protein
LRKPGRWQTGEIAQGGIVVYCFCDHCAGLGDTREERASAMKAGKILRLDKPGLAWTRLQGMHGVQCINGDL